jgi:hypothetical protein
MMKVFLIELLFFAVGFLIANKLVHHQNAATAAKHLERGSPTAPMALHEDDTK